MQLALFHIKTYKHLFYGLFVCLFSPYSLSGQELPFIVPDNQFHCKPVHSFKFYLNNAIYPKAKFTNQNPNPKQGWDPLPSYGAEITIGYNLSYPSGFGFSAEAFTASVSHNFISRSDNFKDWGWIPWYWYIIDPLLTSPQYFGFSVKFSYIKKITPFLFIQPNTGIKFPFYIDDSWTRYSFSHNFFEDNKLLFNYMYFDTKGCKRQFVPELTTGIDFLFHTKRNPRSNFILGVNLNLGFTPRFKGYYSITPPYTEAEKDCDISIGSTFFGINLGYQFTGLPKTYDRKSVRQERRRRNQFETFDFKQLVHSFGFVVNTGFNNPATYLSYVSYDDRDYDINFWGETSLLFDPGLSIKYNCAIKKGWGIGFEIPFGMMLKAWAIGAPFALLKTDTVFLDNALIIQAEQVRQEYHYHFLYSGLGIMASYLAPVHSRMFIHPEIGIKFVPFLKNRKFDEVKAIVEDPREEYPSNVQYATVKIEMPKKNNFVPDMFIAVNFLVHGKKNKSHNFVFGINTQICFVNRLKVSYQTTDVIPFESQSKGWVNFRSTSFGLHFGYLFLKGINR